jgi:hypothetical protein
MKNNAVLAALILALAPGWASAEVLDSASNGFTVKTTLNIHAAADEVYLRLVRNVGDWWNPQHAYSHDSHNLSIEEKVNGCFCERLPDHGGVRHMEVVNLSPGKALVMNGALGPLQSLGATGSMSIALSPAEGGTKLEVTYAVSGYLKAGLNTWAAPVDSVVTEQFTRLKNYIERGDPAPK